MKELFNANPTSVALYSRLGDAYNDLGTFCFLLFRHKLSKQYFELSQGVRNILVIITPESKTYQDNMSEVNFQLMTLKSILPLRYLHWVKLNKKTYFPIAKRGFWCTLNDHKNVYNSLKKRLVS